jgi:hypothetical protein
MYNYFIKFVTIWCVTNVYYMEEPLEEGEIHETTSR